MTGMIQGGWEFVWTAYGVSFTVLAAYGISLALRLRDSDARARARAAEERESA